MNKLWWVIFGLLALVVGMIIFWPEEKSEARQELEEIINQGNARVKVLEGNLATIREKVKADSLQGVKSKQEYEVKVTSLRSTVAKLKANPRVIEVLKNNPEVDSLVIAQDSTIQAKDERIVALEADIKRVVANMDSFNDTYEDILKAEREKFEASQSMNKDLEKQVKKEKRKGKFKAVLIPVVGVGMLLLGAQL